jgi:hypothetical protein
VIGRFKVFRYSKSNVNDIEASFVKDWYELCGTRIELRIHVKKFVLNGRESAVNRVLNGNTYHIPVKS